MVGVSARRVLLKFASPPDNPVECAPPWRLGERDVLRFFGWISALIGLTALGTDLYRGPYRGEPFELAAIGEYWAELSRTSLIGLNSFTEKNISPGFWDVAILPALGWPAALAFVLLALFLFFLSGRRRGKSGRKMLFPR